MSSQNDGKLKSLQRMLPPGGVLTQQWLDGYGIYRQLTRKYILSGWLDRIGSGAFKRHGDEVLWEAALNAVQKQLALPIHIGAKSALEIKGGTQYLKLGNQMEVFLFSHPSVRNLPKWFNDQRWEPQFTFIKTNLFPEMFKYGYTQEELNGFKVTVSSKERAIFELLYLIPRKQTWDETNLIFENLTTLRPKQIQKMLECCSSIKIKRLFLFFSEKHNHQWFKRLGS